MSKAKILKERTPKGKVCPYSAILTFRTVFINKHNAPEEEKEKKQTE